MGNKKSINKGEWRKLKNATEIKYANRALCVLQEVKDKEDEKLGFMHDSFQNYFLARYYAMMIGKKENIDEKNLDSLLRSNSEFAVMYIEQLMDGTNELAKKVCKELLIAAKNDKEKVVEYARGILRFCYNAQITFTIEDFLAFFPSGKFIYEGIVFDRDKFKGCMMDGYLEMKEMEGQTELNGRVIAKDFDGVLKCLHIKLWHTAHLGVHYDVYLNGRWEYIYETQYVQYDRELNKHYGMQAAEREHEKLRDLMNCMVSFMGKKNNYWCFFEGQFLFVYQMISQNEEKMSELFRKGYSDNAMEYIFLYGLYRAKTTSKEALQGWNLKKISDVSFDFGSNIEGIQNQNSLIQYYWIYEKIRGWFRNEEKRQGVRNMPDELSDLENELQGLDWEEEKHRYKKHKEICKEIEDAWKASQNEKLTLSFTDELLYALYLMGEGERMVNLARETINLCEQYGHTEGIELRELLMRDDFCFDGENWQKVYEFAKKYVWI